MSEEYSDYLASRYNELQEISDEYVRNANAEFEGLTKQLALFSSVFLPLVGVFISSDFFQDNATVTTNRLTFVVILSQCATLLLGAWSYLHNGNFYKSLVDKVDVAREIIERASQAESEEETEKLVATAYEQLCGDSKSELILWFALGMASLGVLCFISIMYILLNI